MTDQSHPLSVVYQAGTSAELERLIAEYQAAEEARDGQTAAMGKQWRRAEAAYAVGNLAQALAAIEAWIGLIERDRAFEQAQNERATATLREKLRLLTESWKGQLCWKGQL